MDKIFELLQEIEDTQGTLNKKELLKKLIQLDNGEQFLRLVFNDDVYNISDKVIMKAVPLNLNNTFKDIGEWARFQVSGPDEFYSLNDILTRVEELKNLSGNKLVDYLKFLENYRPLHAKFFVRMLKHTLGNGIELTTVNNCFQELGLKPIEKFGVQLCGKVDCIEDWNTFPVYVGVKYDGFRCIIKKEGDNVTLTSRQGKGVDFVPEIVDFIKGIPFDFILDGEIMAKNFNEIQKRIGRKEENIVETKGLHFRMFDILKFGLIDYINLSFQTRRQFIIKLIEAGSLQETDLFKFEEIYFIDDTEQLQKLYKEICDRKEEGIVIKLPNNPYEFDSRTNMYKVKPVFDCTCKIINCEKGTGKYKDSISKLHISDKLGIVTSWIGSGLSAEIIDQMTSLHQNGNLIGMFIDVKFNEITTNQEGGKSFRFPRFVKFRTDKSEADDLSSL